MYPALPVGPLRLQTYGLGLLLAFFFTTWLAARRAPRRGVQADHLYNLSFNGLLAGLVGARLAHGVAYFSVYRHDPLQLLSLSPGALLPAGGVVAALVVAAWYTRRQRLSLPVLLDIVAPAMLIGLAVVNVTAWLAGRDLGLATTWPWGMSLFGVRRHPVALLNAALLLLLAATVLRYERQKKYPGELAWVTLFGYAAVQVFLTGLRAENGPVIEGWRVAQLVAWAVMVTCGMVLSRHADRANRL
ncbi:MAG: prolipoprotein diacylglyceryl transferase family protein [Caldilineales bacterium]